MIKNRLIAILISLILLLIFCGYYNYLSIKSPLGAGPDEMAHHLAIAFIYSNKRLAVYPDDVDHLHKTPYGTTRSFREPFYYVWSALVAKAYLTFQNEPFLHKMVNDKGVPSGYILRKGNVLLGAGCISLLYLVIYLLSFSHTAGLVSALGYGLLPQFAFLASYMNNDVAAVFVYILFSLCVVSFAKWPRETFPYILGGVAAGLVLIAKPIVWIPTLCLLFFVLYSLIREKLYKKIIFIALPLALVTGGWWYAFNMYHHGIDDPRNSKVRVKLAKQYKTLPDGFVKSYGDLDYSACDLLANKDDFLIDSFQSTVGKIGLLRVSMGKLQYWTYAMVFVLGLTSLVLTVIKPPWNVAIESWQILSFCMLIGFFWQMVIYLWWNLNMDAQPQGRYLLPSLIPIFIGFGIFYGRIASSVQKILGKISSVLFTVIVLTGVVLVHAHAMLRYVIPYFYPGALIQVTSALTALPIKNMDVFLNTNNFNISVIEEGLLLESTGPDSWLHLDLSGIGPINNYIEIEYIGDTYDIFKLYLDYGSGFTESNFQSYVLRQKSNTLSLKFPIDVTAIRLDFGERLTSSFKLFSLKIGQAQARYPLVQLILNKIDKKLELIY